MSDTQTIDSSSSDIIQKRELRHADDGSTKDCLHFRDGKVLVISHNAVAFYQSATAIDDELGNGLIALAKLADADCFESNSQGWVKTFKAGFVGLNDERALLITPLAIQLFNHKQDALYNRNEVARLDIPA